MTIHKTTRNGFLWISIIVILVGMLLRVLNLMQLPMFTDEVLHITRAHRYWLRGDVFDGLEQNKWLYIFFLAQFKPMGPEGPWLSRYLNVLFAMLSLAGCISLGKLLDKRSTGLLAGLIYAALPLAVFHERQSLVDPMMTAFTTLSLVASVHLARRPRWWLGVIFGLVFSAAILTKPAALPFVVLPPLAVLIFNFELADIKGLPKILIKPVVIWLSGAVFTGLLALVIYRVAAAQGTVPHDTHTFRYANTGVGRFGWDAFIARIPADMSVLLDIGWKYIGPFGLTALIGVVVIAAARQEKWRKVLWLSIPGLMFAAIPVLASRPTASDDIATRYLLPNAAALAVLMAMGVMLLPDIIKGDHKGRPYMSMISIVAIIAVLAPMVRFDWMLLTNPPKANYTAYDQRIYFDDNTSGYRYVDVSLALVDLWREQRPAMLNVIGRESTLLYARAQVGPRISNLENSRPGTDRQRNQIETWLAAGETIYIVEELGPASIGPDGTQVEALYIFDEDEPGIYVVTGLERQ